MLRRKAQIRYVLRTLVAIPFDMFNLITRRTYRPALQPYKRLNVIDEAQGRWEALEDDPQFLVVDRPLGYTRVMVRASSDIPVVMGFYYDNGKGLGQSTYVRMGVLKQTPSDFQGLLPLGWKTRVIRFDPTDASCTFTLYDLKFQRISRAEYILQGVRKMGQNIGYKNLLPKLWKVYREKGFGEIRRMLGKYISAQSDLYVPWLENHTFTREIAAACKQEIETFSYSPTISVILPVYDTPEKYLREAIDSVLGQVYPQWELCIADDASTEEHIQKILEDYQRKDPRIKLVFRPQNGHISAASNSALDLATGEFIATLDHDDLLTPDALFEVVKLLNAHQDADMIYSDEDKISTTGHRFKPYFKPDWSPDLFLSHMYTAHLAVYRRSLVERIGGYRLGYEGAQDYDLVLRLTEQTDRIYHIPKILYSWRRLDTSTAAGSDKKPYASEAARRAIEDALQRRNWPAQLETVEGYAGQFNLAWAVQGSPLVSIVILTRDKAALVDQCLHSIFAHTTYPYFEVVLVDNGSQEEATRELIRAWEVKEPVRFRSVRYDIPFNFHTLNNLGAKAAKGEVLLFLNNDTQVITPNWVTKMTAQVQRPEIGVVGAMLLYPDDTIQHAGIVLGINHWAGHSHKHSPGHSPGYEGRLLGPSNYAAITGACLMIETELFWSLDGMQEELQIACGDVELCLRTLDAGLYNVVLPDVRLYHYESASRGYESNPEKQARFDWESSYVISRWPQLFENDPFYNPNLTSKKEDFSLAID